MDKELKANQATLRQDLIAEVERYLGYAEDVHSDYISVNKKTFEVGFRSRHNQQRKPDFEYYSILDFMMSDSLWFKVDNEAIEAVVQEHLPSPNIDAKFKEWCEVIKTFLVAEQPTSLHSCRFSIGSDSGSLSCFDEQKEPLEDGGALTFEEGMEEEWETVAIIPIRKAVSKTSTGYTISGYNLTKLILNYTKPSIS